MRIVTITATFNRDEITLDTLNLLKQQKHVVTCILVGTSSSDKIAAERAGAVFIEAPNQPLGEKWQAGVMYAKRYNPDAILICGSDDWLSANWCEEGAKEIEAGFDLVGTSNCYMVRLQKQKPPRLISFARRDRVDPIGAGRMISGRVLNKLKWQLFSAGQARGLDEHSYNQVIKAGGKSTLLDDKAHVKLLCVKSDWEMLDPWDLIMTNFANDVHSMAGIEQWLKDNFSHTPYQKYFSRTQVQAGGDLSVMFCGINDWANLGQTFAKCLQLQDVTATMYVQNKHAFKYASQGTVVTRQQLTDIRLMEQYEYIVFMHSGGLLLFDKKMNPVPEMITIIHTLKEKGKKIIMMHGGSDYRRYSDKINRVCNEFVDITITQTADLLNLGALHENWVLAPVDTATIRPTDVTFKKLRVAHYPSRAAVKGTDLIINILKEFETSFDFVTSSIPVAHDLNLKRMDNCDIYVDHQGYLQKGKRYGEFGIAALEAASLGKIVITCSHAEELYEKEYGQFVPYLANTPEKFKAVLKELATMTPQQIQQKKRETRAWVEKLHSYEHCGKRLITMLGKYYN